MDAGVVDDEDVGMIELSGGLRLLLEAAHTARIDRERPGDELDRDVACETRIARAIHLAHPPGAKPRDDLVGPDSRAWIHVVPWTCVSVESPPRAWNLTSTEPMPIESPSTSSTGEVT